LPYVHDRFQDEDGKRAMVVRSEKGPKPDIVKDGPTLRFFVRRGKSTVELQGGSITDYVKRRFELR
jgi:hypothetical protein